MQKDGCCDGGCSCSSNNTEMPLCHITLRAEMYGGKMTTVGSPCIKEKCMMWVLSRNGLYKMCKDRNRM